MSKNVRIYLYLSLAVLGLFALIYGLVKFGTSEVNTHDQERTYYLHQYEIEIKACSDKGGIPIRDWSGYKMKECQFPPLDMRH